MGISRVALASISLGLFILVVISCAKTTLHTVDKSSSSPVLRIRAEGLVDVSGNYSTLIIEVKHEYGRPVTLSYIEIEGLGKLRAVDFDTATCNDIIKPGDQCIFIYTQTGTLEAGVVHNGVVVFSEGVYPVSLTPVYVYSSTKNFRPEYDTYVYGARLINTGNASVYSLVSNATALATDNSATVSIVKDVGLILIDLENYRWFGGLGFAYDNTTNIEQALQQGAWFISLVKLVNSTGKLPLRWGIGLFQDHLFTEQPEEMIAFIGIMVNNSGAFFVIERYDRDKGLQTVVDLHPVNTSLERLLNDFLIISAYISVSRERNRNTYLINGTLYDITLTPLASTRGSFEVSLPGTPGQTWIIRPALAVMNSTVLFREATVSHNFVLPLITVRGIPCDYVLEVYINGSLAYRAISRGDLIVLPFTQLDSSSQFVIKYPTVLGELVAYKFVLSSSLSRYTEIEVLTSPVNIYTAYNQEVAAIVLRLPVGDGVNNFTGFATANLVNTNEAHMRLRMSIQPELSVLSNLTLTLDVLDTDNSSIFTNILEIRNGSVLSSTTNWSRLIKPRETLLLYISGYYGGASDITKLVIRVETIVVKPENYETLSYAERTIVLFLEPYYP